MMRSNLLMALALSLIIAESIDIHARYHETITLTDGSVISGFVSKDNLANGDIEIEADWAVTSVPADDVEVAIEECRAFRLDSDTKEWLTSNNIGIPETVHFASITMTGDECNPDYLLYDQLLSPNSETFDKLLLEKGDILRYADLTPKTYYLNWSKIAQIDRYVDDPGQSWIEVIVPSDGEAVEGIIESQVLRHHRTIKSKDGIKSTFLPKNINSILKEKVQDSASLLEIVPIIDIIEMEPSAGGEILEGVITENNRSKRYFVMLQSDENGETSVKIPYSDIKTLRYRRNM